MHDTFDLDRALASLAGLQRVLILPHDDPDPDAMAAAWALSRLFEHCLGARCSIGYEGMIGRAENRAMVQRLGVPLHPLDSLDLTSFEGVMLVDTQPGTRNHSLPAGPRLLGCVDHHPIQPLAEPLPWVDVRPQGGTSASITLSYLLARGLEPDAALSTALLYGLKSDTRDFSRAATPLDMDARAYVYPRADHAALGAIINPRLDPGYYRLLRRALDLANVQGPLVTLLLGELPYPDLVAEMADLFVRHEGVAWCLCGGVHESSLRLSLRTELEDVSAGAVLRNLVCQRAGAAGGHDMIAGGRVRLRSDRPMHEAHEVWDGLVRGFVRALGHELTVRVPLVGSWGPLRPESP
jgi:nanoRNase/pAp phosphatase (c-di-AMP/oligoRNAs hydrolase)